MEMGFEGWSSSSNGNVEGGSETESHFRRDAQLADLVIRNTT